MPDWETVIEFTEKPAGKFASADVDPRVHAPEGFAQNLTQMRTMFDEGKTLDSAPLKEAAPALSRQRARTEEAQRKVDIEQAMGTAPNLGTGTSFEEMGFHEPTPDKGRLERIKEGIRANEADVAQFPWYLQTPYRIGRAGGQAVQGVVEEGKNIYRTAKEALAGDADPRNITKTALDLFGSGTSKAMSAAPEFGATELGAFSKSGRHLTFGPRLKEHVDIKTNFPEADFWIVRKGDATAIGKPTREYSPEHIGIRSRNHNILPDYLYYAFEAAHGQGHFRQYATGATKLQNLRLKDIEELSVGQIMRGRGKQQDVGAFGGRGPGGRIEKEDLKDMAKRLRVHMKDEGKGTKGTEYVSLKRYDKGGVLGARVRIPSKTAKPGRDAGRRHHPDEILFDTSDAPLGKKSGHADPSLVENASGGRYSDIRNLEAAMRFMFAKGDKENPNFLISPQDRPYIWPGPKPEEVPPAGPDPAQGAFNWDEVVEFK